MTESFRACSVQIYPQETALRMIEPTHLPLNPEIRSLLENPPFPKLDFGQHSLVDGAYTKVLHPGVVWHLTQQAA